MTDKQDNKLAMYRAVIAHLTISAEIIATRPALTAKLAKFQTMVSTIPPLAALQADQPKGVVVEKNKALAAMATAAIAVAGAVQSYADEKHMDALLGKVSITESQFRNGRQQNRITRAQQVHDAAATVVADMADYGLTAATLQDLQEKITTATTALSTPRSAAAAKKAATKQLPAAFKSADRILIKQIDPLLPQFKESEPAFYEKYQAARIIIDRGSRSTPGVAAPETTAA
ncbi:MAG TPA: hypothetical protein VGD81_05435 [Opitutaceae bacterium]